MPDDTRRKHRTKWTLSLRAILLPVLIPILLLVAATIFLSSKLDNEVRSHTLHLEQQTVNNVLLAQRNSANLQSLSNSLRELVYATQPEQARSAYINAWGMLSESTLDQHEHTRDSTSRLLESLNETWLLRKSYDAKRSQINDTWANLYEHLLSASGLAAGISTVDIDLLRKPSMHILHHLDDANALRGHLLSLRQQFKGLCSETYLPKDPQLAKNFAEHCGALAAIPGQIKQQLSELSKIHNDFFAYIQVMTADAMKLRQDYSAIETTDLLASISQTNDFYDKVISIFFSALLAAVAVTLVLAASFYAFMHPLSTMTQQMHRFLATNEIPRERPVSHVTEVSEVINWMMHFCQMIREKRESLDALSVQYDKLLLDSHKDPLTGLGNRKAFEEFASEHPDAKSHNAVLMIDIDFFKEINDTHGHMFGDQVLEAFGRHIRQCVSRNDMIYRYGGEEFCVLLNDVTPRSAREVAERICRRTREISRSDASVHKDAGEVADPLTVSIGISAVTTFPGQKDILTLVREADMALYRAKEQGRDRACSYVQSLHQEKSKSAGGGGFCTAATE